MGLVGASGFVVRDLNRIIIPVLVATYDREEKSCYATNTKICLFSEVKLRDMERVWIGWISVRLCEKTKGTR